MRPFAVQTLCGVQGSDWIDPSDEGFGVLESLETWKGLRSNSSLFCPYQLPLYEYEVVPRGKEGLEG